MKNKEDHFQVLRKIYNNPETSQRSLAQSLGFSLGKLNYCLKALEQKGLVKIQNLQIVSFSDFVDSYSLILDSVLARPQVNSIYCGYNGASTWR